MKRIVLSLATLLVLCSCGSNDSSVSAQPKSTSTNTAATPKSESRVAASNAEIAKDYTEQLFQNPFDSDAVYFLSQKSGTPQALSVLIKRDSQNGTQYSRWQFNCAEQTAQNFGVAENLEDLNKAINSSPSAPQHYELKSRLGAIATAVCPK